VGHDPTELCAASDPAYLRNAVGAIDLLFNRPICCSTGFAPVSR
jgi:hypothetical protein